MPKNLGQSVVFGVLMVIVMVYFMICYNISMDMGGLTPAVFLLALEELPIMAAIAFVLEFVALGKLAKILAFRFVNPATDKPMVIILAISAMTVCCMCPVMSFIATLMHSGTQALFTIGALFIYSVPDITFEGFSLHSVPLHFFPCITSYKLNPT